MARASALEQARVDAFLRGLGDAPERKALAGIFADYPRARALTDVIADGSPYLFDLIAASPARWLALLGSDPQARLAALLADMTSGSRRGAGGRDADLAPGQRGSIAPDRGRRYRRRLGSSSPITQALTQVGDAAVGAAVRHLLGGSRARRRARRSRSGAARGWFRLLRAGARQDGCARAQLLERHRPYRDV